jgi:hypothetical protein
MDKLFIGELKFLVWIDKSSEKLRLDFGDSKLLLFNL